MHDQADKKHFLFFDNYFSTFNLLEQSRQNQIYAIGTVKTSRFVNPPFYRIRKCPKWVEKPHLMDMDNCRLYLVKIRVQ